MEENVKNKLCFKSEALKELRRSLEFTQDEIAKEISISPITYQMWELGKNSPNNESLEKFISFLNRMKKDYPKQYDEMVERMGSDSAANFYEMKSVIVENKKIGRVFDGELLKNLRCALPLTQELFGKVLRHENGKQGVFFGTVSKWERGERTPKDFYVEQMALIFGVDKECFYKETEED